MLKNLLKTLKAYSEYHTLFIAVVAFFLSPFLFRAIDPTAATYDAGILQKGIVAIIFFSVFQAFTWFALKLVWPSLAYFLDNLFKHEFYKLSSCQKVTIALSVYFALFFLLALLTAAI